MNWDYYTFERQPPFWIETIAIFMNQEALAEKETMNRMKKPIAKKKGGYKRF